MNAIKKKKNRLSKVQGMSYIDYINNEQVLSWAMMSRLRAYMLNPNDDTKGVRDVILRGDCRMFIEAVIGLPYMQSLNLGMYQEDIDELYLEFMKMIHEEEDQYPHQVYGILD